MQVLIIAELTQDTVKKATEEIASAGKKAGTVSALVFGEHDASASLKAVGVDTIYHCQHTEYSGEIYSKTIAALVKEKNFNMVLFSHSWFGKDISARVAALLNVPVLSDAVDFQMEGEKAVIKKPIYAAKGFTKLSTSAEVQVITVRPNAIAVEKNEGAGKVESYAVTGEAKSKRTGFKEAAGEKISLTDAAAVVSGGRGVKGPDYFTTLQELADLLNGALGASRAAVDADWISHSHQVGQTGKTVSPNLYIACGISGSIQHMAGMNSSRYIVAVNTDADAPIFKVATYGLVHDLFEIVPEMIKQLKA